MFQGYSGWGLRQFDKEIANDSWIITENKVEDIFSFKKKNSWNNLIKKFGHKYRLWSNSPDDITLN